MRYCGSYPGECPGFDRTEGERTLQYESAERSGVIEVTLHGRITYSDHPSFRNVIAQIRDSAAQRVVFEMGDVEFIDSAGLGMLLMVRDTASQKKAEVVLRRPRGQVERIFASSKFDTLFTVEM